VPCLEVYLALCNAPTLSLSHGQNCICLGSDGTLKGHEKVTTYALNPVAWSDIEDLQIRSLFHHEDQRGTFSKVSTSSFGPESGFNTVREAFWTDSKPGVARGMHLITNPKAGSKIVSVMRGRIIDLVADLRPCSPTFLNFAAVRLSPQQAALIPKGCAHGFIAERDCSILYLQDCDHSEAMDRGFSLHSLPIHLPIDVVMSERDNGFPTLEDFLTNEILVSRPLA